MTVLPRKTRPTLLDPLWRLNAPEAAAPRSRLRAQLNSGRVMAVPGVYDGLAARIAALAGFECLLLSEQLLAESLLALPAACLSSEQLADGVLRITGVVDVPLCVCTGVAVLGPVRTGHALHLLEKAGAAAVWLDERVQAGEEQLGQQAMVAALHAACAARIDIELIVGVRCHVHAGQQYKDVLRRCLAYHGAGAELIVLSRECMLQFPELAPACRKVGCLVMFDATSAEVSPEAVQTPPGKMWVFERLLLDAALHGMTDFATDLVQRGSAADLALLERLRGQPIEDWYQFTGFDRVRDLEGRYLPGEALAKYAASPAAYYQPAAVPSVR